MPDSHDDDSARAEAPARVRERRRRGRSWGRRKHVGLITTGVAVLVLAVGLLVVVLTWDNGRTPLSRQAAASGTGTSGAPSAAPTAGSGSATTPSSAPAATLLRGTVAAVGDNRYTVSSSTGIDYTVLVTATTTFSRNRGFDSYAEGQGIAVRGTLDSGVITATSITPYTPR